MLQHELGFLFFFEAIEHKKRPTSREAFQEKKRPGKNVSRPRVDRVFGELSH